MFRVKGLSPGLASSTHELMLPFRAIFLTTRPSQVATTSEPQDIRLSFSLPHKISKSRWLRAQSIALNASCQFRRPVSQLARTIVPNAVYYHPPCSGNRPEEASRYTLFSPCGCLPMC